MHEQVRQRTARYSQAEMTGAAALNTSPDGIAQAAGSLTQAGSRASLTACQATQTAPHTQGRAAHQAGGDGQGVAAELAVEAINDDAIHLALLHAHLQQHMHW